jgi:predicted ATP-grasp superfamily ATP-dependent carboligase
MQAAIAGASVKAPWAAYTSNFENYPAAVTRLAQGRRLLGNSASTLTRVRDPLELTRVLKRHALPAPECRSRAPLGQLSSLRWLLKPRRSGGGHGITTWRRGHALGKGMYLQQRIAGVPGSISFAANGASAVVLGFSRQLVGDPDLGAGRYRYCGSILGAPGVRLFSRQDELLERAAEIVSRVTGEFRLVGLNGIDFIARQGIPYPTEVNPRYSGSMELIERAHPLSMFETHFHACHGILPLPPRSISRIHGKAIVFARRDVRVGDLVARLGSKWVADLPYEDEQIQRGRPICTVFAAAAAPAQCRRLLGRRAAAVYRAVTPARCRVA